MLSNRLAFIGVGSACIVAAFGGGYLASRQNVIPVPAKALESTSSTPAATLTAPDGLAAKVSDHVGPPSAVDVKSKVPQPAVKRPEPSRALTRQSPPAPVTRVANTTAQEPIDRTPAVVPSAQSPTPPAPTV